jgi:hypothetical protein
LDHCCVRCDEHNGFGEGLSNKGPIKGILVQGSKPGDGKSMLACDGQFRLAILKQATPQQRGIDHKSARPQAVLDGNSPMVCGRKHGHIARIFAFGPRCCR